jgi:hypothetical protein
MSAARFPEHCQKGFSLGFCRPDKWSRSDCIVSVPLSGESPCQSMYSRTVKARRVRGDVRQAFVAWLHILSQRATCAREFIQRAGKGK